MQFKRTFALLASAVITLGAFSGCSSDFGTPRSVVNLKKNIEKQGYTAEMEHYGDFGTGMSVVRCHTGEGSSYVEVGFDDGEINSIYYTYDISDPEDIDNNIQGFEDYVTEYSEMLDIASEDISLEKWPANGIFSDPAFFELYRNNARKSSSACNGYYDFNYRIYADQSSAAMGLMINVNMTPYEVNQQFINPEQSTDNSEDETDTDEDNTSVTANGKAESYNEFKYKMFEIFDEGCGVDSTTLQGELNIFSVYFYDGPNNSMAFDVSNDGTINSITYKYEILSEVSDDEIVKGLNTFISDSNAKAMKSGYYIPMLTSDLDEGILEKYFENKDEPYELVLEDGRVKFIYYPDGYLHTFPAIDVKILNDTESSADSVEPSEVVEFKKDIEQQGHLPASESFDGVF